MPRILAIDYGGKRTGIAVTDDLQIIATALDTIETKKLIPFLEDYFSKENVTDVVIGLPVRMNGELSDIETEIQVFIKKFQNKFPLMPIHRENEAFTSKMAAQTMFLAGVKKKKRQEKGMLDKISATIILQSFLAQRN